MANVSPGVISVVRDVVRLAGAAALAIDDLCVHDLGFLRWSGSPSHVKSVGRALERVPSGDVDYLVVRAPSGEPVAKGGLEHTDPHGPGMLWQLATHDALQSLGIGTHLVLALENRARGRGLLTTWLGVEVDNPRARRLYERLDYVAFGEEPDGWESQDADGRTYWYETRLTLMRKTL